MEETEITVADSIAPRQDGQFTRVYQVLADAIAARAFPGCAFGVLVEDVVVLQDALGASTYDDEAFPIAQETVFDIASVSKVIATTAAVMLLVQRNQLDLDTPLGELLPGFVVGRNYDPGLLFTLRPARAYSGLPGSSSSFGPHRLPTRCFEPVCSCPSRQSPERALNTPIQDSSCWAKPSKSSRANL